MLILGVSLMEIEKNKIYWPIDHLRMDIRELIDGIPVGVALISPDLRIHAINRAMESLTGFNRKEAYGVPCRYIMKNNLCTRECPARNILAKEDQISTEGDIINLARQKVPVIINLSPLKDHDGKPIGVIETVEDISLVREFDQKIQGPSNYHNIIGHSPQMEEIFKTLQLISQTDSSVLITGETGTGKDLVAEAIHLSSMRAKGPFIKINCGALPENLLESELFGHKRGAFTGAWKDKRGLVEEAHQGTLFLDEIGDLNPLMQTKLLRLIQEGEFKPVGSVVTKKADMRFIAATNHNLKEEIEGKRFREDLYYRLNVIHLELPPLKERKEDISLLSYHFLKKYTRANQKEIIDISLAAMQALLSLELPGNVRELENIIERGVIFCQTNTLEMKDLFPNNEHKTPYPCLDEDIYRLSFKEAKDKMTHEFHRHYVLSVLRKSRGNISKAAAMACIQRQYLHRLMKEEGIDARDINLKCE